jgi:small subunit ribosomal protein S2
MQKPDIKVLLEAGAHFGHKTSRWHPKMAPYIHSKRGEIHIINLEKTVEQIEAAQKFAEEVAAKGQQILFVSTKRQAKDIIKAAAEEISQPYVVERWLGGMLTNSNTISTRVKKLKDLESKMASGELNNRYNKLEVQRFQEQIDAMNVTFGGIKDMQGKLGAVFVVDIIKDETAIKEANRLGVPVIAMVDTNTDPSKTQYPIASNDDAIKAIALITSYIKEAVADGRNLRLAKAEKADTPVQATPKADKTETIEKPETPKKAEKPVAKKEDK